MEKLLVELNACEEAMEWAKGKSWKEVYENCYRGDWLLWLFKRTNPNDLRQLTLAKAHCAKTVIHLMKDERSRKAVDAAIKFGEGSATIEELKDAADAAYAAAYAADAAAADAAYAAAYAADAAAADAAYDAAADAYAAKVKKQKETADICRKYLQIEIWNIKF